MAKATKTITQYASDSSSFQVLYEETVEGSGVYQQSVGAQIDVGDISFPSATKDNGPAWTVVRTVTTSADMTTAAAISAAPTTGQRVVVDDLIISTDTAMTLTILEETSSDVFCVLYLAANSTVQLTPRDGFKANAINKKFFADASATGNLTVTCFQHSE